MPFCGTSQPRGSSLALREWNEHRGVLPIHLVGVAEERDQVVFFKLNGQKDVARRRDGKKQVALRHPGRSPEGDEEAKVNGVANALVEHGRLEANRVIGLSAQVKRDLPQAKKVRVAHHKGTSQDGEPTKKEKGQRYPSANWILDIPHNSRHRPPLPIEQIEAQAGQQDVRAPFDCVWNKFRPRTLEPLARHHAMLDSEETEQKRIDHQGLHGKIACTGIDGFGNDEVTDKADGVEKRHEENQVCNDPKEECCDSAHGVCLLS